MIWLALVMACGEAPPKEVAAESGTEEDPAAQVREGTARWTVEAALAPTLDALDRNADGRVVAGEYRPVKGVAPNFREIDEDDDGALSVLELRAMSDALDPQTWDGNPPRKPVAVEVWSGMFHGEPPVRKLSELMRFVRSEVRATHPDSILPTDAQIQAAAETGDLQSPEVRAIFVALDRARNSAPSAP